MNNPFDLRPSEFQAKLAARGVAVDRHVAAVVIYWAFEVFEAHQLQQRPCPQSPTGQHVFEAVTDDGMVTTGSYKGKCKYCGFVP